MKNAGSKEIEEGTVQESRIKITSMRATKEAMKCSTRMVKPRELESKQAISTKSFK